MNSRAMQRGVTLLEVLVAFVLLTMGVVGTLSLHATAKRASSESVLRQRVVFAAESLLESVRANPGVMSNYVAALDDALAETASSEPSPDCSSAACSAEEQADHDLWRFESLLRGSLAVMGTRDVGGIRSPHACILFAPAAGKSNSGTLSIIVQWHGVVEQSDAVVSGAAVCGSGDAAGSDPLRRQLVLNTFILDEAEL